MSTHNVVIIGSGPAGWTAALYAARAQLKPLVFEGAAPNLPGGQLMTTTDVENYPGFPEGVDGKEMMELFKKQAVRFGTEVRSENVAKIDFSKRPFAVTSEGGDTVFAHAVIGSTGATAKYLGLPNERDANGQLIQGLSACATCDGAFYKNVEVAVVGGGDTAMEEALFLTRHASKVTIVHRRDEFRASKVMLERARKNAKIAWELNAEVAELVTEKRGPFGKDNVVAARLKTKSGEKVLKLDGVFVAIGHQPNVDLFKDVLKLDDKGYLQTLGKTTRAMAKDGGWLEGLFLCGDVQDSVYRQAVTAAGSGCAAAIDAERWLAEHLGH